MSLGVLNNISAIYAQNNLSQTQSSLQNTLTQLSSGSRINSGADDAAGLSLANGLGANAAALTQSATNASSGVGLLQVADGALSQVTNLLNRAITLATEASNGTLNTTQDAAANQEYQSILAEINNIGTTTSFNGIGVFGSSTAIFTGDASSIGSSIDTLNIKALSSSSVGDVGGTIGTATSAYVYTGTGIASATTTSAAGTLAIQVGTGSTDTLNIASGSTIAQIASQINGAGIAGVSASVQTAGGFSSLVVNSTGGVLTGFTGASMGFTTDPTFTQTGGAATNGISYTQGTGVALNTTSLSSSTNAQSALTAINSAITDVAAQRGYLGSQINTLNAESNVASTEQTNVVSAQNNILATNYGQATSDLSKYQILSQTGISALAQANSVQQEVLKLLQ
ncbi:MAG TPA: flagellin [Acidobacteriaceae bacterium]|nr:flagellin [Acidobacteriaceae bacterium]